MKKLMISPVLMLFFVFFVSCSTENDNSAEQLTQLALSSTIFTDKNDGTVTDGTGLTWTKCAYGQVFDANLNSCTGSGGGTTFNAASVQWCELESGCLTDTLLAKEGPAFDACDTLDFAGFTDWRLPDQYEFKTAVQNLSYSAYIAMFPQTPDDKSFWTGSVNTSDTSYKTAIGINLAEISFGEQRSYNKQYAYLYVRCVRK